MRARPARRGAQLDALPELPRHDRQDRRVQEHAVQVWLRLLLRLRLVSGRGDVQMLCFATGGFHTTRRRGKRLPFLDSRQGCSHVNTFQSVVVDYYFFFCGLMIVELIELVSYLNSDKKYLVVLSYRVSIY